MKGTVKETFQLRPLIPQSRASPLQEGCPQRNHLLGKGEQENPSELPAADTCSLCYRGLHSPLQECLECPPMHLLLGLHFSETCPQGPQMQWCPTLHGWMPHALPYTESGLALLCARLPGLGHNSVPRFLGHQLLIKRTKAYHYKKSSTHKDKHKERNKGLT